MPGNVDHVAAAAPTFLPTPASTRLHDIAQAPPKTGAMSVSPDTSRSHSSTLRNAASSSFPYSLSPAHMPASITGSPSTYSLTVSTVTAPATLRDTALMAMAARLIG